MPSIPIHQLKPHPAQMRTHYDLDALAALTLQVHARGLDHWQPITASPKLGLSGAEVGTGYHIISGHRRQMAQLLAFALRDWAAEHPETEISVEVVRTMLTTLVDSLGSLEQVIHSLLTKYGDEEISFALFEGSEKAQIMALHAANYGGDEPDTLGVAHSFRKALSAGATPEELERNVGRPVQVVRNHLALAELPGELSQRIAAGDLPLGVAPAVAALPEPQRGGLVLFILANLAEDVPGHKLSAREIRECAAVLKKWPGLQRPLLVKHQTQRNIARALVRLWNQVVEAYPEEAYAAAAMLITREAHEAPWQRSETLSLWFQVLGGDTYYTDGRINWTAVVNFLLPEVACDTCPIARQPAQRLQADLARGQGDPLGMPCRAGEEAVRCLHGLAPGDAVDVRVPWEWSDHPGVVSDGGEYRVKSIEDLQVAWQAQAAAEQAAALPDPEPAQAGDSPPDAAHAAPAAPDSSTDPSPIAIQRARIAAFMAQHEDLTIDHPFATACARCRHRLEGSPTKDPTVPHCAWAGRRRNIAFTQLVAEDDPVTPIPVCRQFAPAQAWQTLIPAHPQPPGVPRDWLKGQIRQLVAAANRHGSVRNAFEYLTGRPLNGNDRYSDWFARQLTAQGGELSDAQLFTLFLWAHAEWQRAHKRQFTLPVNGQGIQFVTVQERPWRPRG